MRISWQNPTTVTTFQNAIRTRVNQGMTARQVYVDIAKSSNQIFGSKVSAMSLQKQASRLRISPFKRGGSRKGQPVTSSFTSSFTYRGYTEAQIQEALSVWEQIRQIVR